jgi:hypothetical protein
MLRNIDQALYARFKKEGYRMKKCAEHPVTTIPQLVQLAYLDVNRTIRGIETVVRRLRPDCDGTEPN